MSRHNVVITPSRPQAEYVLDAIEADTADADLAPDELDRAKRTLAKVDRALSNVEARVSCGPDCSCRRSRRAKEADRG